MDQKQQSVQKTQLPGKPDQTYQYAMSQIESHSKPSLQPLNPAADGHDVPVEANEDQVQNSNYMGMPHQIFHGQTKDTQQPLLHPSQDNLKKDEMKITNMSTATDPDPSIGDIHSIFSSQMLQGKNVPEQREHDEFSQFHQQFSNMDISSSQSPSMQQQKEMGHNSQMYQSYQQFQLGSENTHNIQQPHHNHQFNPQMQMMREAQHQQRVQAQFNDGQQFMTPGKMNMNMQMLPHQAVISQKSEMTPSMSDNPFFNQGIPNDVMSYQTDENDLKQRNQKHNLLQNAHNTIYQKNSQTDILNSSQRKMSDNQIYSAGNNKNVLLDDNVNKLVDFQDPSESASNFNQQHQLSQIKSILDDDEDSYPKSESTSNLNQKHDQFQDVAIYPQFDHRIQNPQKQMPYYNDPGMLYHQQHQNYPQKLHVIQNQQLNQQNYSNDHTNKIGGYPANNNQIQIDKNNMNISQNEAQRMNHQHLMSMQNQGMMNNKVYSDAQPQQFQGNPYMQQLPQQRKPQATQMNEGIMNQPTQYQMSQQNQMDIIQQQMNQGQLQEAKFHNNEKYDQNLQISQNQNMIRAQYQQHYGAQQMQQHLIPQFDPQQDQNSKFLSKLEDQQKNVPIHNETEHQFDYLSAQAHELINQNKQIGQQMQIGSGFEQHHGVKMHEEGYQYDQQQYSNNTLLKGFNQNQMYGQDDQQQMMSPDESQQLSHLMQKQMALDQKYYNQLNTQQPQSLENQSPERYDIRGQQNQLYDQRAQNQFLYQPAEKPHFNEAFYPQNFQSQGQNQSQYLQQKHQYTMNQKDFTQNKYNQSSQYKQMSVTNSNAFQGQSSYQQNFQRDPDQQVNQYEPKNYNQKSHQNFEDHYYNSSSPNSAQYRKKMPQRRQAHSEKDGYPQSQNFDNEPIDNLNINNLSSAKNESRAHQNQSNQIQPKGRTRRTGSSYVQSNKPMEIISVKVDVQDIDIDNVDDNQDQSSQGTSKNKSGYSSGSKQIKDSSSKRSSNKRRSSNNNGDEFGKDQTDCTNSGLVDTDSGHKQHNSFNEQQSFTDSRGIGKGSRGGNSNSSKSGHHSLANSNQSYDEFIQQIQHDIKKANRDPEKEFQVLNGHIIRLATKKVGSKFLQEHLGLAKQSLINKIIDQIDEHLPNLMTDNYGNYFCSELIKYLQVHQRIHFMKQIKGKKFIEISCNNRGTYTLQNIIYAVTQPEEFEIIRDTLLENNNICFLAKDKEGHHMLEKIITTFKEKQRHYIFQEIMEKFNELATDKNGLCVLKKLIQHTKEEDSQKQVVAKILQNDKGLEYVQNAFGNFVVSEVLNQFTFTICQDIFTSMKTHFVKLSQNKFASKFIEVCIDKAPTEIQDEIVAEFCDSPDLNRVVQSQFGNFVLQNSIACQNNQKQQGYCKTEQQRIKLIHSIILSIKEVTDYKVQTKWGQDILSKFIQRIQNEQEYNQLYEMLKGEMEIINHKQKLFKQQQHIQFESYQNNPQKAQGRKNANQGHQYPPTPVNPQYAQEDDKNYFNQGSGGNWSNFNQNRINQYDRNQENHYQKNATKWAQKGKNSKNKKGGNNQQFSQGQQKNYSGYKNQNNQQQSIQSNQYKQNQGKPQTMIKRDNIMFAENSAFSQDGQNGQFDGHYYPRHSSEEQNHESMMDTPDLNQISGTSRNSGIRQNSIYNDPTMLNQDSSGGTSEKANKQQPNSAEQSNE